MNYSKNIDILIIGAGASGLFAGIFLANKGKKVIILEHTKSGGKKILASGNGHCNISNRVISTKNYISNNNQLIKNTLIDCSYSTIENIFKSLGLTLKTQDDNRVFPYSMQSLSVLKLLKTHLEKLNVEIFYEVKNIDIKKGFEVSFNNKTIFTKNLIIATGSIAAPQMGASDLGYKIAKYFGHNIIKPIPALVPLVSKNLICKVLNGIKVKSKIKLFINNKESYSVIGDILFREYGVSGLAILDISTKASIAINKNQKVYIQIDFFPEFNKKELIEFFQDNIDKKRDLKLDIWLNSYLNSKISNYILKELNLHTFSEKSLNRRNLNILVDRLKDYKIDIIKTRDFKYAEVAYGGVDSKEIKFNFESKKQKGLFFIGEVLDIVGKRGGYNFHFAWCSALKVANSI